MAWSTARHPKPKELLMPQRPTSILTTLAVSVLALTLIAPWVLGQDPEPQNPFELRRRAEQGLASAQYNLGIMYEQCWGVPEDYVLAYAWYNLVPAQGNEQGQGHQRKSPNAHDTRPNSAGAGDERYPFRPHQLAPGLPGR